MTRAIRKKTQDMRDRLLDAAEDVFNEKGVSSTTLSDIAEAAGVTRGAIYWHFRTKVDLFHAMIDRVRTPIGEMIEEIADEKTEDPLGSLREKTVFLMRQIVENAHYRKVMSILYHKCEYVDEASEFLAYYQEWRVLAREALLRVLTNARQKKQLPEDVDIDLAGLALQVLFNGLLNNWLLMPTGFNLPEDSDRIYEAIFSMLRESSHMRVKT
jgi:TetR/AcrR family acrAB operon transcriptional repressor